MPYQRPRIPIGERRERVTVQILTGSSDDGLGGQTTGKWKPLVETWAAVTPLDERDKEALRAQQMTATHAYHVAIPYTTQVTPEHRLLWRDKTLQIHTVTDDESRRRRLVLQVAEIQGST